MRIEVLVGSEDPVIYPLNSNKLSLGSGEQCDIVINADGLSRKHLVITTEEDKFFVTDQGSTNGSFINEERLIPGRKTEFTSFFPVRLGDNVLISLLSDEEGMEEFNIPLPVKEKPQEFASSEATTVISLNDLKKVKTENLVLERNQKREVRKKAAPSKPEAKKKNQKSKLVPTLSVLIVLAAGYYNIFILEKNVEEKKRVIGQEIDPKTAEENQRQASDNPGQEASTAVSSEPSDDLVPENEWPKKDSLNSLRDEIKCTNDQEKYLCDVLRNTAGEFIGAVQVGLTLNILVNLHQIVEDARKTVRFPKDAAPELVELWHKNVRKLAFYHYLRAMPLLDETMFQDMKIAVILYLPTDTGLYIEGVAVFYPKALNKIKPLMRDDINDQARSIAEAAFVEFERYVSVF